MYVKDNNKLYFLLLLFMQVSTVDCRPMPANFIMKMQFFPVSLSLKKFLGFDDIRSTECIGDFNATPTTIRVFYVQRQCPSVPFMREIFGFVRIRFVLYRCTDEGIKKD